MPVRRVDPPDDLGAERLRRKDGLDVDANHSPVRTQRGGGIRLGSRNGGRRLHTILGSSEGQPSTRLTEAGYAVSRRVDEGGAGRRSHRRGPRTSTWPSDRPPDTIRARQWAGTSRSRQLTAPDMPRTAQDGEKDAPGSRNLRSNARTPGPGQGFFRADDGTRTRDPHLGKAAVTAVSAGICASRPPSLNKVAVRGHKFRAQSCRPRDLYQSVTPCPGRCRHTIVRWEVPDPVLAPTRLTKRRHRGHQPGHQEHQAARLRVPEVRQQPSTLAPPLRHPRGNIDRSHQSDPAKSRISGKGRRSNPYDESQLRAACCYRSSQLMRNESSSSVGSTSVCRPSRWLASHIGAGSRLNVSWYSALNTGLRASTNGTSASHSANS
jgi:hypothetical protein